MRLAETPRPAALVERLFQIDATRAPLHPLVAPGLAPVVRDDGGLGPGTERALRGRDRRAGLVDRPAGLRRSHRALGGLAGGLQSASGVLLARSPDVCLAGDGDVSLLGAPLLAAESRSAHRRRSPGGRGSRRAGRQPGLPEGPCPRRAGYKTARREPRPPGLSRSALVLAYSLGLSALLYSHPLGMIMAGTLGLGSLLFVTIVFRDISRLARGPSRGVPPGGALVAALLRPFPGIPLRPAADQVPPRHPDRVHRRQFGRPARGRRIHRLRDLAATSGLTGTGTPGPGRSAWSSGWSCRRCSSTRTRCSAARSSGRPDIPSSWPRRT